MKRVYCLYRVSTAQQVDVVKDDIPMQRIACHDFAARMGWTILVEKEEKGISGFKVLDGAKQFPSFTVTEGSPAYFSPTSGKWVKYNGTEWKEYTASTFTEGKYKLMVQVRIDYLGGDTHVLDKSGVTVTVDGNVWNADAPFVHSNYSYAWLTSGEFVVNKTVTTYTVSFNANGGTGTMANVTVSAGAYTLPANSFTAPAGKQFKGWATGATAAVNAGTT